MLSGIRCAHIINSDYAVELFGSLVLSLSRTLATHGRYPAEQGNNVGLPLTAGLFQHATNLHADRIGRNAIVARQIFHGFPGSKAAGDAGFGSMAAGPRASIRSARSERLKAWSRARSTSALT